MELPPNARLVHPFLAILPLLVVGAMNAVLTWALPRFYGPTSSVTLNPSGATIIQDDSKVTAIWAVEAALVMGILTVFAFSFRATARKFAEGSKAAVSGALLASMNTASSNLASAPSSPPCRGFIVIRDVIRTIPNPLVNEAVTVTVLAGVTGSASGGLGIALAAMASQFIAAANAAHIPLQVLHRVASMASGGLDSLPHNGAIITLLAVTGLTHRQSYRDIFVLTGIKTVAVFFVILVYYSTGIV